MTENRGKPVLRARVYHLHKHTCEQCAHETGVWRVFCIWRFEEGCDQVAGTDEFSTWDEAIQYAVGTVEYHNRHAQEE